MATCTVIGPLGVALALPGLDVELHGVRAKRVGSGRESNGTASLLRGPVPMTIFYVDGRRSSREAAVARLRQNIGDGETVVINAPLATLL